jgi:type IV secretory pathway TraG/TraD family ATPase VirD4
MVTASGTGSLDPLIGADGSRALFFVVLTAQLAPILIGVVAGVWWRLSRDAGFGTARGSLAGRRQLGDMHGRGALRRALKLRPSLGENAEAMVPTRDLGLRLGRIRGGLGRRADVYASEEDVLLEIAGPRSNKTSAVVVPAILSAPGPVITTSNKVDAYTLTVGLRSQVGRVFVLDPQAICGAEQTWWWDPLAEIHDMADAHKMVTHFSQTIGSGNDRADPFFTHGAELLMSQLFLAAARTGGHLRQVRRWLATQSAEPVGLLQDAGLPEVAEALLATIESPHETRGGLYQTAVTAMGALHAEAVARYVTPPHTWTTPPAHPQDIEQFDPWRFVVGYGHDAHGIPQPYDTLYLLTQEGAGTAAPVVAALVDHLLRTTARAAQARGGRVDPPVRAVLDEAANICPIKNLPDLYSYFGSMSIQPCTFLQSYQQGVAVWGKAGMDKLWSASTIKLVGAGVHDASFCEDVSRLTGEHDVLNPPSYQRGRGGGSTTMSTRRDRILPASAIAALPKTEAVLISSGRPVTLLELLPWYAEPDADRISGYGAQAQQQVREAAIANLGPANPLAQQLRRQSTPPGGTTL